MPKEDNLTPFNTMSRERAVELSRKGGKAMAGVFQLSKTRNCNKNCPMFGKCWTSGLSPQFKGKCALANIPQSDILGRRTVKAILDGERGFCENMLELLTEIEGRARTNPTLDNLRALAQEYREMYPLLFGTKARIVSTNLNQGGQVIDIEAQIKQALQPSKEPEKPATEVDAVRMMEPAEPKGS